MLSEILCTLLGVNCEYIYIVVGALFCNFILTYGCLATPLIKKLIL